MILESIVRQVVGLQSCVEPAQLLRRWMKYNHLGIVGGVLNPIGPEPMTQTKNLVARVPSKLHPAREPGALFGITALFEPFKPRQGVRLQVGSFSLGSLPPYFLAGELFGVLQFR